MCCDSGEAIGQVIDGIPIRPLKRDKCVSINNRMMDGMPQGYYSTAEPKSRGAAGCKCGVLVREQDIVITAMSA